MRMDLYLLLAVATTLVLTSCSAMDRDPVFRESRNGESAPPSKPSAPRAKEIPHHLETHGHVRVDPYYWLKDRENPEVIRYLEEENRYTDLMTAKTADLRKKLFEEIKNRIKQTDTSVPFKDRGYYYYSRTEDGKQYPVHCRKKGALTASEEILLDVNQLAEGHDFVSLGALEISSGEDLLAYALDTQGRRIYTIYFKNLSTGELLEDTILEVTSNLAWANDNKTVFYTKHDPETLRSYQIYKHTLGTDASADELIYEESDDTFSCFVYKTRSRKYLIIGSTQTVSSEYRFLDADRPDGEFQVVSPRRRDHEYDVDHFGDHFYIRTNHEAKNFRLIRTPVDNPGIENWQEILPHRNDVLFEGIEIFRDHFVIVEREAGLIQMRIRRWDDASSSHRLDFGEPAYLAYPTSNYDFETSVLRYAYTSMTTPNSTYDYDMETREKKLLKRVEILGGFDPANYETRRLHATARDGAKVPISVVYRKGIERNGNHPLLLYAYGSYGYSMDATFSSSRLSLLDRGFVFAIAHVRGGEELGRRWYEDGKLFAKKNTFNDFVDCAESLISEGYTRPDRLFAEGGSAGGLLMGAIINDRPELFRGVIADVPFVDVVTTMLDDSIPLTTGEYDEWGDPRRKKDYDYILSYSPYDNVTAQTYPNLLVTTGIHDSQVQYWEPAKWVAKLRATKTGTNLLLLKTEMEAGHGGVSGRYRIYEETAFRYGFLLDLAGISE